MPTSTAALSLRRWLRRTALLAAMATTVALGAAGCDETTRQESDLRVVELIGRDGGQITSHDGGVTVTVPPGATDFATWFVIEPAHDAPDGNLGPAWDIHPSQRTFLAPLTVTLRYGDVAAGADPATLRAAVADGGSWRAIARPRLDTGAATISVETTHLSTWSLIVASCDDDSDCVVGETCGGSTCGVTTCGSDADCPAGVCAAGLCGPVPPCAADADCPGGEVCVAGACMAAPECTRSSDCPTDSFCVGGACQSFGCSGDAACGTGFVCIDGSCEPGPACQQDTDCAAGEICVDGTCEQGTLDCTMDADCQAGEVCVEGTCEPETTPCTMDTDCASNEVCNNGVCEAVSCTAPLELCAGACVDTTSDTRHCGACLAECNPGETCDNGNCTVACAADELFCGSACIDPMTNETYCGDCDTSCDTASAEVCEQGACLASDACTADADCTDGDEVCDPFAQACTCAPDRTRCGGTCVDTLADTANCGTCGTTCGAGEVCNAGTCETPVSCTTDMDCAADETCDALVCTPIQCAAGESICDRTCVATQTDSANCGACGMACAAGVACVAGMCDDPCAGGLVCGGSCVDPMTDTSHCGGCDMPCAAGEVCSGGTCETPPACTVDGDCTGANEICDMGACVCDTGFTDCSGTCLDVNADDPANCGACGMACAAGESCVAGTCTPPPCVMDTDCGANELCNAGTCECDTASGYTDCGGVCTNLNLDDANCGACTMACNAGDVCTQATCGASCTVSMDCGGGNQCVDGGCWPNQIPCATDLECPATWTCNTGNGRCAAP